MSGIRSLTVKSGDETLFVRDLGSVDAPPLIMLHGMQDVGQNLMPIAASLAARFRVIVPDLRGHGASSRPGTYAMPAFVYDLHQLQRQFAFDSTLLFGHSLGGQILTRFAALYPERARALVVVEGLGPPTPLRHPDAHQDAARTLAREAQVLLKTHAAQPRLLDDLESAAARLSKNNPRLSADRANELAGCMTQRNANGGLEWAFDPRVPALFTTPDDAARYWPHVQCPALIIAARHAGEYWRSFYADREGWDGSFAPGELEARVTSFPHGSLAELDQSGHMAHFDQPDEVSTLTLEFLSNHADKQRPYTDEDQAIVERFSRRSDIQS